MVATLYCFLVTNLLMILTVADEDIWTVTSYPNPLTDPQKCNRPQKSFICDPDSILLKYQADRLNEIMIRTQKITVCVCQQCPEQSVGGFTVGVALMKKMFRPYNEPQMKVVFEFAENLRKIWKLGHCGNDIIILVATEEKQSNFAIGPKFEEFLGLAQAMDIYNQSKLHFSNGNYYQGLESILESYYDIFRRLNYGESQGKKTASHSNVGIAVGLSVGFVALVALAIAFVCWRKRRQQASSDNNRMTLGKEKSAWEEKGNLKPVPINYLISATKYAPCNVEDPDNATKNMDDDGEGLTETPMLQAQDHWTIPEVTEEETDNEQYGKTVEEIFPTHQEIHTEVLQPGDKNNEGIEHRNVVEM
ncbi:uncharacterized protein LOC111085433 [Limulus polyphemus]|uniref:Uncharacterized protein LOC111085433 n=1 Tax=Limulus polyphemus TaxID=6850 RepID=A0ABM1S7Q2_LIMPO|nr:uncharacterized protein LOC111085433 [Limulus polyphemus]